jgi:thiol-disulfide isomerase/thioredoxin
MKLRFMALTALAALVAVGTAQTLNLGSPAPKLQVAKWIKGKQFTDFDSKKIYVVEFWATWCGPCREAIPHVTEMAKKFGDKVTFTGVSIWEDQSNAKFMDNVVDFVKQMGDKMNYNVAAEGTDKAMAKSWMEPAGQEGIPASFVIKDNKIAWIGHPMELEPVLDKIVAGSYDMAKEKDAQAKAKALQDKMGKIMPGIQDAAMNKDWPKAIAIVDQAINESPELKPQLSMLKFNLMIAGNDSKAGDYAKEIASTIYKDDPEALNSIAWSMVDPAQKRDKTDYPTALAIAEKAVEASKGKDWMILDTLALCQFNNKMVDKALATQEKAVAMMKADSKADPDTVKELNERLEMYKKAKAGGGS